MRETDALLPGEDLVVRGLADLAAGRESAEALLVAIGAPRLRRLGVAVPPADQLAPDPETSLYRMLEREQPRGAHARYNALVRRLVSYEHALEAEHGRRIRRARAK